MKLDLDDQQNGIVIELLPLVDVVFCILTFFILAAVGSRQQAISLDLPNANTGSALPPAALTTGRDRLYVSVDPIGRIYLDQDPILEQNLLGLVGDFYTGNPEGIVVLYAAKDSRYDDVVRVLDILRTVGGNRVALATLPPGTQSSQDTLPGELPADIQDLINGSDSSLPGRELPSDPLNPSTTTPIPTTPGSALPDSSLPDSSLTPSSPSPLPTDDE
ncbi:biopolymer transporter ExbD [Leptolyngbyaceae cyanobacterium CCMR0082]|uniref:Biopolymer transporter ExbD n=1 Tax=Adonisia turfae CCMR0082 TaxID=2304604 RepID=A0A6M0S009_9CYAN|nr:biopolymer transporter ExbD [Adonisia turfae]MDV3352133.1 biopolymer transporter ExbD [Leptothoe sp. LEGE 181152]NEZ61726.1 biopolymer transporter ExbD [Adonisia turfae CCMR0082]